MIILSETVSSEQISYMMGSLGQAVIQQAIKPWVIHTPLQVCLGKELQNQLPSKVKITT
jgi:hypothetical protein